MLNDEYERNYPYLFQYKLGCLRGVLSSEYSRKQREDKFFSYPDWAEKELNEWYKAVKYLEDEIIKSQNNAK